MISPMTRYNFVLLNGEQDALLQMLQGLGLVDITRSVKPVDEESSRLMEKVEELDTLIHKLKAFVPESADASKAAGNEDNPLKEAVGEAFARYASVQEERKEAEKTLKELRPWGDFSQEAIATLKEAGIPLHFHRLSAKQFQSAWAADYALSVMDGEDKGTVYFVVAGPDGLPGEISAPENTLSQAQARANALDTEISALESRLSALQPRLPELEALRADAFQQLDLYLAGAAAASAADNLVVTFEGFAPKEKEAEVTAALENADILYLKEDAKVEENPPIAFKNNAFVKMFEMMTDMYGRPAYNGFDPTPFISVFFMLFFAFCMGDCGYGLVLVLAGLMMKKADGMKKLAPLVTTLGVATVVVGFLFHTFFSIDIAEWDIFAPIKGVFLPSKIMGYDGTMVLSLLVGVVHICLALLVKTYQKTKNNGFLNALGTWGWTLLIVGGVIVSGVYFAGVLSAPVTKWVVIILGIVSALGIFLLNDLHRNPLKNIGSGLWETYNTVTGLLGDVLSYLRLYALGLAGAMLGLAFNKIGMMVLGDGSNAVLWIPFALIVLVGHVLNIAMCALGAFVHPLRLNFLEFFKNSGYEAVGRKYNPLTKNN